MNHTTIKCPYCGGSLPEDTTVCPDCQEDLSALAHLEYAHAIHYNQALALAREGELDLARHKLLMALEARESFAPAHILLAKVHARQKAWAEAQASVARAAELSPDNETVRELARRIAWSARRVQEAAAREAGSETEQVLVAHQREVVKAFGAGLGLMAFVGLLLSRLFGGGRESD